MNKILCGKCARKQNKNLEERKELSKTIQHGLNGCDCGRVLEYKNSRLTVIEEGN